MNDNKKGNTVLLTVIAVATLLVAVVGATFAYFTATVAGNESASSVIVSTAKIGQITYVNGNTITLNNVYPGAKSNEITFTVKSSDDSTVDINYALQWVNVENTFDDSITDTDGNTATGNPADLEYYLLGESSSNGTVVALADTTNHRATAPTAASVVIGSGVLKAGGDVHTYTMYVVFKETGSNQNVNQGRAFTGKIEVVTDAAGNAADSNRSTTYYNNGNQSGTATEPTAPSNGIVSNS